jgi:UDP-N-acetylmuramoylalanine--D-glutamate ligase
LDLKGIQALVVGLAREGTALASYLADNGAQVTVTDAKPAAMLADNIAALANSGVRFALAGHPTHLLKDADIVFVSPGVPIDIPFLAEAKRRNVPLSSETRLFTRLCPAPIIGVTGSSGKTTTTALVGRMLRQAGRKTWLGGNIGQPLIGHLGAIGPRDLVVMELSSFQLEFFGPWTETERGSRLTGMPSAVFDPNGWSPSIAALLNLTPNHLDRHGTMDAYVRAKSHILLHQQPGDVAVLNLDNPATRQLALELPIAAQILTFSLERPVQSGTFVRDEELVLRLEGQEDIVCQSSELRLRGRHNVANTLAACALAAAAGAPIGALRHVATTFQGVPHRLELVRTRNGVRWYNDSIATSPERTVAALHAFEAPIVLLAGGRDKHLPWDEMASLTWRRAAHLILFGEAADLVEEAMHRTAQVAMKAGVANCRLHRADTLDRAVELAAALSRPGDVVLLSPGGTSFDAYADFEERGDHFRELVRRME